MGSLTAMERWRAGPDPAPVASARVARMRDPRLAAPPLWEAGEASAAGDAAAELQGVRGMACRRNGLATLVRGWGG